ncbi:phasin family protein [Sphaerotilus hippei]|uniref:Phasin family protein n=1 Tax=Sphaerotilus hippei TaxID=744406 RepID=A0A318H603_9BURK|nr:TIGR01841 family phasin [Sphaerotilus hippei]PXW99404.1 phasin family protein [Sphaerotilus hippei]
MSLTPEQLAAANKAQLESLVALTQQTFKGFEALVELNLQAARSTLEDTAEKAKAAMGVKDAKGLLDLQASLIQPAQEKALAYGRQVADIAASTQAEVTKLAETQIQNVQAQFKTLMDDAVKNAPAGSESATAMMKTAMANASTAFESVQKAAKQAATTAEANFKTLAANAETSAKAAADAVKKTAAAATKRAS